MLALTIILWIAIALFIVFSLFTLLGVFALREERKQVRATPQGFKRLAAEDEVKKSLETIRFLVRSLLVLAAVGTIAFILRDFLLALRGIANS